MMSCVTSGGTVSTGRILKIFLSICLTALLWKWASDVRNDFGEVLNYLPAGLASGIALTWIFRAFASMPHTRRSLIGGAVAGLLAFTPVIALLLIESTDTSTSSLVVLAFSAAGGAALGGAIYGVATLAHDAFTDWRRDRVYRRQQMAYGGAHR
jgi:hypothetical protein